MRYQIFKYTGNEPEGEPYETQELAMEAAAELAKGNRIGVQVMFYPEKPQPNEVVFVLTHFDGVSYTADEDVTSYVVRPMRES